MLISFRVQNFRSFADEQELSMLAGPDDMHAGTLIESESGAVLPVAGIYGANASGKSNLLTAITVMKKFVVRSATEMNLGDRIPGMVPFRLDPELRDEPCRFEIAVVVDGTYFEYGFAATPVAVHSEHLKVRKPGGRLVERFRRTLDPKTGKVDWAFRGLKKKDEAVLQERTRSNGLVLSRAAELNLPEFGELYLWFRKRLWLFDLSEPPRPLTWGTAGAAMEDESFRNNVLRMVRDADLGIGDLHVSNEPMTFPEEMPRRIRAAIQAILDESEDLPERYRVHTTHFDTTGKPVEFSLDEDESNGTQRFFAIAGPVLDALATGATLVVDELECSMHPLLTRKLVQMFLDPNLNERGAQLIFSTHDTSLLDRELLRRDQVWIADKRQNGATELYSLYDFREDEEGGRPRKTESFARRYLEGRYGGVPSFGPMFEDLVTGRGEQSADE